MPKNRKTPRYPQNEQRGHPAEGRRDSRNQFPRDGFSYGSFGPSHHMTAMPTMLPAPLMQHPPTIHPVPANAPLSLFQRRMDNRGLRHRLFNEAYRYAGQQQVYAPPDINGPSANSSANAHAAPNEGRNANGHSSESSQLRGDAPEFVPAEREKSDSAMNSSDQFDMSDSFVKVDRSDLSTDEGSGSSPDERVAWLVVSSTH